MPARRRALLVAGAALVLALVAAWHYATLYGSLLGAREALLAVERDLAATGLEVEHAHLDRAEGRLAEAGSHIRRARPHLRWDPLLQLSRALPRVGDQVAAVDAYLEHATALVEIGYEVVTLAREVVALREADGGAPITAAVVELLRESTPRLERIQALVDALVARRIEARDAPLLGPLHDARVRLDAQLPRLAETVDRAMMASVVLPDLLGFQGERRYLVLSINNAELLPGGGLVTVAGIMSVRDGQAIDLDFTNTALWKPRWEAAGGPHIEPPGPLRRYLLKDFSWNLGTSNWDPDFPTWAQQALELYEAAWGAGEVHGVVAVDLEVLVAMLEIVGPRTLDAPGYGEITLTPRNAVLELERVTRRPSDPVQDKKAMVGDLTEVLLRDLLALEPARWPDLADAVARLGDERHLQLLFFDPLAQTLVRDLGWDGALRPPASDYLHFNEASLNSTKLNMIFWPEAEYRIEVSPLGDARHELILRYHNTFPQWARGKDPALVESLMYEGQYGGYLRVFVPQDAVGFAVEIDGVPVGIEDLALRPPYRWFGAFVPVPAGEVRTATLRWRVPLATDDPLVYELYVQKQPGTRGLCIDLSIDRDGVPAATLDVSGGTRDEEGRHCATTDLRVRATFGN